MRHPEAMPTEAVQPVLPAYRGDIDGLRAIAVLLVVVHHAFPQVLGAGFIGVDVFFVISGFLISSIIFRERDNGRWSLARFYERRGWVATGTGPTGDRRYELRRSPPGAWRAHPAWPRLPRNCIEDRVRDAPICR